MTATARVPDGWLPDTPEEHRLRAELANKMMQDFKRTIAEKLKK